MRIDSSEIGPSATLQGPSVELYAVVDDNNIRKDHPGFDGMEKLFALLPRRVDGNTVTWERYDLRYNGKYVTGDGSYSQATNEVHDLQLETKTLDLDAIKQYGVAFGADTNVGTIWCQSADDNYGLSY